MTIENAKNTPAEKKKCTIRMTKLLFRNSRGSISISLEIIETHLQLKYVCFAHGYCYDCVSHEVKIESKPIPPTSLKLIKMNRNARARNQNKSNQSVSRKLYN